MPAAPCSNTTGDGNVAIGSRAGANQTTGSNNVYIDNVGVAGENRQAATEGSAIAVTDAALQTNGRMVILTTTPLTLSMTSFPTSTIALSVNWS